MNSTSPANAASSALRTERVLKTDPRTVFNAFARADSLARWWGPAGFTNTFQQFEFKTGGRWVFVMHGPDKRDYPNESLFREIQPNSKIAIEHIVPPWFLLTVTLTPHGNHTHLRWVQEFESPEMADRLRAICEPSNEQNLDRLESLLATQIS